VITPGFSRSDDENPVVITGVGLPADTVAPSDVPFPA
jgi:hypothetical protein